MPFEIVLLLLLEVKSYLGLYNMQQYLIYVINTIMAFGNMLLIGMDYTGQKNRFLRQLL